MPERAYLYILLPGHEMMLRFDSRIERDRFVHAIEFEPGSKLVTADTGRQWRIKAHKVLAWREVS